jgi:Secretin and TonB N terminus short domain/TonB-dependent Receptor Plug Domain
MPFARPPAATAPCRALRRPRAIQLALMSLALLGAAATSAAPSLDTIAARSYEIPTGPLGRTLAIFAVDAGIALSFEPALTEGLSSPALSGSFSPRQALTQLLAGSGLELVLRSDGSYTLRKAEPVPDGKPVERRSLSALPLVRAAASSLDDHGGVGRTSERVLKRFPVVNGDVTSALKLNPQVQFDNAQLSALTQGEIAAAEISINGAKFYQNLFMLDGVALNNDLDPAYKNNGSYYDVPGASQGMPLDKDLICNLEVHDSNVSARYGNFQGGVVKAELCEARRDFSGRFSYSESRSSWSHIFVDPAREEALYNSSSEDLQSQWRKKTWRATLQGRPTDELGITAYTTRTESVIPLRGYDADETPADATLANKEQTRRKTDNTMRLDWRASPTLHAWLSLRDEPLQDRYFVAGGRDTEFTLKGGGQAVNTGLEHQVGALRLRHDLSQSEMSNSRRGAVPYYK